MSEANVQHLQDQGIDPTEPVSVEETARGSGWVPKEEWDGDPNDWVDAREYNFRGELMTRIKKQSNHISSMKGEVDSLKKALRTLGEHNKKIAEAERKKALKELKAAKKEAFADQDFDAMEEIDDQIDELKSVNLDEPIVEDTPTTPPEVEDFLEENPWYNEDVALRGAFDAYANELLSSDPKLEGNPAALLKAAKESVQEAFPEKFNKTRQRAPAPVAEPSSRSSSGGSGGGRKATPRSLSSEQRKIGETFVQAGAFKNLQEYVDQLAELGEVE